MSLCVVTSASVNLCCVKPVTGAPLSESMADGIVLGDVCVRVCVFLYACACVCVCVWAQLYLGG